MKTICAYCLETTVDGTPDRISHSICPKCERLMVAAELLNEARIGAAMLLKARSAKLRRQGEAIMIWVNYGLELGLQTVPRKRGQ